MRPAFNSIPYRPTQLQNGIAAAPPQQVMPSNQQQFQFQGNNPINLLAQIQSQMGIISNPQMPFNTGNNPFLNVPNQQPFPFYGSPNLNTVAMNQFNMPQLNGQLFPQNGMNQAPFFNQNMNIPNGQFCMPGPMQTLGQFAQMPNCAMFQGQVNQARGPHIQAFSKQLQGNSSVNPGQLQQTQNFRPPVFTNQQVNPSAVNITATNGEKSQGRNFTIHPKPEASQGFAKSPARHIQNAKGKFKFHNKRGEKGHKNEEARKSRLANTNNQTQVETKKSLSLHYTEQEIQLWLEARKRNFPSKTNIVKKMTRKLAKSELKDKDAELRRQQLKEVLAKQVELGCEVAEIPSHYLCDSEKPVHGWEENKQAFNKRGRFRNQFNKKGRRENNQFTKKPKGPGNIDSANLDDQSNGFDKAQRTRINDSSTRPTINAREPTLLQKLLRADIQRDRARLLQVFKFMVMNSFFKDHPEKPLIFPLVMVKEGEYKGRPVEENSSNVEEVRFEGGNDEGEDFSEVKVNEAGSTGSEEQGIEEEGEIID